MKITDLSTYVHSLTGKEMYGLLAVGWLDQAFENVSNGPAIDPEVLAKLRVLLSGNSRFRANIIRGQEPCELCSILCECNGVRLGWSELWIPFDGKIYVSPDLILHYIEGHGYLPPMEYINALMQLDERQEFNAEEMNERLIFG